LAWSGDAKVILFSQIYISKGVWVMGRTVCCIDLFLLDVLSRPHSVSGGLGFTRLYNVTVILIDSSSMSTAFTFY
jgi:hypothetical protein